MGNANIDNIFTGCHTRTVWIHIPVYRYYFNNFYMFVCSCILTGTGRTVCNVAWTKFTRCLPTKNWRRTIIPVSMCVDHVYCAVNTIDLFPILCTKKYNELNFTFITAILRSIKCFDKESPLMDPQQSSYQTAEGGSRTIHSISLPAGCRSRGQYVASSAHNINLWYTGI